MPNLPCWHPVLLAVGLPIFAQVLVTRSRAAGGECNRKWCGLLANSDSYLYIFISRHHMRCRQAD